MPRYSPPASALDEMGLCANTMLLFSSDNGPDTLRTNNLKDRSYGASYPLRIQKRQIRYHADQRTKEEIASLGHPRLSTTCA